MWTRPFQIAVRNQSEAELSDCREQGAQALRRELGAASRCINLKNGAVKKVQRKKTTDLRVETWKSVAFLV